MWQTCVISSAMYGLLTTQFTGHMVSKLRAWFHRQLRAVVNMPAHLTKINNREVREQFGLADPIQMLIARIESKISQLQSDNCDPATKGTGIISFWQEQLSSLQQADAQATSAHIIEASGQGQHACPTCGLYYSTKKALRQHQALRHGQIQADRVNIDYKPEQHSVRGMPQCRHCKRKLYNWSALQGHITLNVCNWYPRQAETASQTQAQETLHPNPTTHVEISQPEPNFTPVPQAQATQPDPVVAANAPDPLQQQPGERCSASDEDSAPLLKQERVLQHLQQHEGVLTQADLRHAHLSRHCGFCGRWIAEGGMIKTHILRVHKELAAFLTADFHKACTEFKYMLKRSQNCRWCGRIVHGTDRHCSQCPVLFQLLLAEIHRREDSTSQEASSPQTWPMTCPAANIAACLADPLVDDNHDQLKDMALTAKAKCLLCGETVQDIQAWRRHLKQKHGPQHEIARGIADSATVLNASITRPCPWCRVHFQKSAREHRRKCLPLLQLGLRHDSITNAHGDDARAAAGDSLGAELPACPDGAQPTATRTAEQAAGASGAAEQVPQRRGKRCRKGNAICQEDTRAGGGGAMDGFGARRSNHPPDTAYAGQGGSQARATADILGSGQELRSLPGNRQPWHDQHADPSQPGMAPTVRGRHSDYDAASHSMGSSMTRMASQAHQDRAGHPGPPNSGDGQLDFADSAPVGVHRVECGAEEGPAIKQRQPLSRSGQASRSQPAEEHGEGRHCASAPEPQATPPRSTGRCRGDALDPDHPSTCSRGLSRPGPAGQQLRRKGDRTSATRRKGQQDVPGEGAGKTTVLSWTRPIAHQTGSTSEMQGEVRSPLPKNIAGKSDTAQSSISSFFKFRGEARFRHG